MQRIPKPPPDPGWRPAPFGSRIFKGCLVPSWLDHRVKCESEPMLGIARRFPRPARWLWQPVCQEVWPDAENGGQGIWVLCVKGKIVQKVQELVDGDLVSRQVENRCWEAVFDIRHPLLPRFSLVLVDEIDYWIKRIHPAYQTGSNLAERLTACEKNLKEDSDLVFKAAMDTRFDRLRTALNSREVRSAASSFMCAQSKEDQVKFSTGFHKMLTDRQRRVEGGSNAV